MKRIALALSLLVAAAPLFAQTFAYHEPERDAPAATSRMFVRSIDAQSLRQGVDLPATGGSGMIILMLPVSATSGHAAATLRTPTGDVLAKSDAGSPARGLQRFAVEAAEGLGIRVPAMQDVIHVERTEAAQYHLTDIALPENSAGLVVVAGEPDSRLTLTSTVGPLSRHANDNVTLRATLADDGTPITGARVTARLAAPAAPAGDAITLFDDGRHDDGAANDGVYAASVTSLPGDAYGFWTVRYDAEGTNAQGVAFARSSSNEFMNERPTAHLRASSIRTTRDGDVLHVRAGADVLVPGRYRLDVIVVNGASQGIATGEATVTLTSGAASLAVDIPGVDTDDIFLDVRLLSLGTLGLADRTTTERSGVRRR